MAKSTVSKIEKAIRDAKENNKEVREKIIGHAGLTLRVRPNGTAEFRQRYTHPIIKKLRPNITLGCYPTMSLADAKDAYNANLALLAKGIDPKEYRDKQRAQLLDEYKYTVGFFTQEILDEYQQRVNEKKLSTATLIEQTRKIKYINQAFQDTPIKEVTPTQLIEFLDKMKLNHGAPTTKRIRALLSIVYAKAIVRQAVQQNLISAIIQGYYRSDDNDANKEHLPAITTPAEFGKLLNDIDRLENTFDHTKDILQLLPLLFCRIGDLCSMKWADIDFVNNLWNFTPQKKGSRKDMTEVTIPLSKQALAILARMKAKTGDKDFVFFTTSRKKAPYTDTHRINSILNAKLPHAKFMNNGKGYQGIHCPHGFRACGKTMLIDQLKYSDFITELQIGHRVLNSHGNAYGRMEMIAERIQMMQEWADYLDDLRAGKADNIIYLHQAKKANTA